ncbi:MAG: hypothetical protein WC614_08325 [bacterium]
MATISNANLAITHSHSKNTARCVVTCRINFTTYEVNQMKEGLRFRVDCKLWGEDLGQGNWLDPDDYIYTYGSKYLPDASPTNPESLTFDVTVGESLVNEDTFTDEIYGQITLTNLYTLVKVKVKTNVVTHSF